MYKPDSIPYHRDVGAMSAMSKRCRNDAGPIWSAIWLNTPLGIFTNLFVCLIQVIFYEHFRCYEFDFHNIVYEYAFCFFLKGIADEATTNLMGQNRCDVPDFSSGRFARYEVYGNNVGRRAHFHALFTYLTTYFIMVNHPVNVLFSSNALW